MMSFKRHLFPDDLIWRRHFTHEFVHHVIEGVFLKSNNFWILRVFPTQRGRTFHQQILEKIRVNLEENSNYYETIQKHQSFSAL